MPLALSRADGDEGPLAIRAAGMWLCFAQDCAAVVLGMHLGLSTPTNTKRDLSSVKIDVILTGRPTRDASALMEIMAVLQ